MKQGLNILLVDDDEALLRLLAIRLQPHCEQIATAAHGSAVLPLLHKGNFDCVITDLRMPDIDGLALFKLIQGDFPLLPVIIMSAHGTVDDAMQATQAGAMHFITKPLDHDKLMLLLNKIAQHKIPHQNDWPTRIIAKSNIMLQMLEKAHRIAKRDVNVLITGDSGTGKELLAQEIHEASLRREQPFVAVNCAAIPENLLESELFGYKKGAFTGAMRDHPGLFQQANGGTLFLDEIGDMNVMLQAKLLRVLQERIVRPLGSVKDMHVDVRVICATHQDLSAAMHAGAFREDLYYRLNVVDLHLPQLKKRSADIPILVKHFIKHNADRYHLGHIDIADDALAELMNYPWPGNIRQLGNVIEQCVALVQGNMVSAQLVRQALRQDTSAWPNLTQAKDAFEFQYLNKLLHMTSGNVTKAADLAGRNRSDLHKLLKKHDLIAASFRE
jgi:two-component system response regulator GlrR